MTDEYPLKKRILVVNGSLDSKDEWLENVCAALDIYGDLEPEKVVIVDGDQKVTRMKQLMENYARERNLNLKADDIVHGHLDNMLKTGKFFNLLKREHYSERELTSEELKTYRDVLNAGLCVVKHDLTDYYLVGFPQYRGKAVAFAYGKNPSMTNAGEILGILSGVEV